MSSDTITQSLDPSSQPLRPTAITTAVQGRSPTAEALRRLRRDHVALAAAAFLLLVALISLLAPVLAPRDPIETNLAQRLAPIGTPGYLLGADDLGRDILSRLIWGGRISLIIGFSAVMVAMVLGILIGLVAGFFGGWLDALIMRLIDILLAFPAILLAITIVASLGPGLRNSMLAVSIVGIPYYARIVRGSVLSLREQEFVHAARLIGAAGSAEQQDGKERKCSNEARHAFVAGTLRVPSARMDCEGGLRATSCIVTLAGYCGANLANS